MHTFFSYKGEKIYGQAEIDSSSEIGIWSSETFSFNHQMISLIYDLYSFDLLD